MQRNLTEGTDVVVFKPEPKPPSAPSNRKPPSPQAAPLPPMRPRAQSFVFEDVVEVDARKPGKDDR